MNLQSSLVNKKPKRIVAFLITLSLLAVSIGGMTRAFADENDANSTQAVTSSYSMPNVINPDTDQKMYVVKSTFYDYYSDSQITVAAEPSKIKDAITSGNNTFSKFNKRLLSDKKYGSEAESPAKWPLYEGLFFSKQSNDKSGGLYFYDDENAIKNFETNFWLGANHTQTSGVAAATQGLVDTTLDNNGNITQSNSANSKSCVLPYFDKKYLTTTKHVGSQLPLAKVYENVAFPLVTSQNNGTTFYSFDSSKDTVIFNSKGQLNYQGQNTKQVKDSEGRAGFFPFNNTNESKSYNLNYGFGIKMEIPFSMTADGKINGQDMIFEFAGDDDLWVYVDGELVLDVGGIHGEVSGKIDFANMNSIVSAVKNNDIAFSNPNCLVVEDKSYTADDLKKLGLENKTNSENGINKNVKTDFSQGLKDKLKDVSKVHTMTVFYMERGKVGSNLKLNFNMPEANQLELANIIDYNDVGKTFLTEAGKISATDVFTYDIIDKDSNLKDVAEVKGGESVIYQDKFKKGETLMTEQVFIKNKNRKVGQLYKTGWILSDRGGSIASSANRDGNVISDGRVKEKDAYLFKNKTDEEQSPNLTANFVNKVQVGNLIIQNQCGSNVNTNKDFSFEVVYSNVFGGDCEATKYVGEYVLIKSNKKEYRKNCKNGVISLKAGERAVIKGVPVMTKYQVKQSEASGCELEKVTRLDGTEYTNANKIAEGTITAGAGNENAYVFYNKSTGGENVKEVVEKTTTVQTTDLVEPVDNYQGAVKDEVTPKTGDDTKKSFTTFWIVSVILSAILVIYTGVILFKPEKKKQGSK